MTREEKQKAIDALKISAPVIAVTQEEFNNYIQTLNQVIDWLEQESNWIPVDERLPEENKTVIASTKYAIYPETKYTKKYSWEWAYESGSDYWEELEDVTAWMPLPKLYEPRKKEAADGRNKVD